MEENNRLSERVESGLSNLRMPEGMLSQGEVWQRLQSKIDLTSAVSSPKTGFGRSWQMAAAVIAVLFIAGLGILIHGRTIDDRPISGVRTHVLPCGSEVQLGEGSRIAYNKHLWNFTRQITIDGQAQLKVTKGRSFDVEAGETIIAVLGTEFTVWCSEKDVFVHCTEGKVNVRSSEKNLELIPEEFVRILNGKIQAQGALQSTNFIYFGEAGAMNFDNLPLEVVCAALAHRSNVSIINNLPKNLNYSGGIDPGDMVTAMEVLAKPYSAKVTWLGESEVQIDP